MKKKLCLIVVSLLLVSTLVFLFASCDTSSSVEDTNESSNSSTVQNGKDGKDGEDGEDGKDGREVEFNVSDEYIQWRYVGDEEWTNLIALSQLKGEDGEDGKDGKDGRDGISINTSQDPTTSGVGVVANTVCAPSVARIYMYESSTSSSYSGLATAFLISDSTSTSTERYLITNAHCARYLKAVYTTYNGGFGRGQQILTSYEWASYGKIVGYFENDDTAYDMEIVAYGAYDPGSDYSYYYGITKENDQADFAVLKVTGTQPDNTLHPSLKIASSSNAAVRGDSVAIIGNPEGMGSTNSIAIGAVSQTGITISSWGAGTFLMTDVAINGGNSGGPMVDATGRVVGVVESKLVSSDIENMGFALDSDTLISFLEWVEIEKSIDIEYTLD